MILLLKKILYSTLQDYFTRAKAKGGEEGTRKKGWKKDYSPIFPSTLE